MLGSVNNLHLELAGREKGNSPVCEIYRAKGRDGDREEGRSADGGTGRGRGRSRGWGKERGSGRGKSRVE